MTDDSMALLGVIQKSDDGDFLKTVAPEARRVGGTATFVYHLFPNVIIATFPYGS